MYLEHLNLVVRDIQKSLSFYQVVFPHWKIRNKGKSEWYGVERNWIHFGDDYQYLTFNDDGTDPNRDLAGHQIGLAHFGYVTLNLDSLMKRLTAAGFEMDTGGAENKYRKNAYYIDPDGYEIEFIEYLSDNPEERNSEQ